MEFNVKDILTVMPIIAVTLTAFVIIVIEALFHKSANISYVISICGLIISIGWSAESFNVKGTSFFQMVNFGGYGNFFSILFMVAAIFTIILSNEYLKKFNIHRGEYYVLILFSTVGMMLIASAADIIVIFLGLELMSICLYVLAGFVRKEQKSNEAALKYFLLGAFATGFLIYGMALIYGVSGTTNIQTIVANLEYYVQNNIFWIGMGLMLVGFAFKIAAVPFHMWVPDVYEGSPTTIAAFMATGAKAAPFSALIIIFSFSLVGSEGLKNSISFIAVASMILGNLIAISQNNIKRMLAYSSIAHAGYMLIGLAATNELGRNGILFYLSVYTFMNIGAFGILSVLENTEGNNLNYDDYAGFASKHPFLAAMMTVFMLSLIGIPPFAGFFGKYYVFVAAIQENLIWLVIIGVLMSAVSAYYYLRLVMVMYFRENNFIYPVNKNIVINTLFLVNAIALFCLGIVPSYLLNLINSLFK